MSLDLLSPSFTYSSFHRCFFPLWFMSSYFLPTSLASLHSVSEPLHLHLLWSTALLFLATPRYHRKHLSQPLLSSPLLTPALFFPFLSSQKLEVLYALYGTPKVSEMSKQASFLRLLFAHATHFLITFPKSSSLPPASKAPVSCQQGLRIIWETGC